MLRVSQRSNAHVKQCSDLQRKRKAVRVVYESITFSALAAAAARYARQFLSNQDSMPPIRCRRQRAAFIFDVRRLSRHERGSDVPPRPRLVVALLMPYAMALPLFTPEAARMAQMPSRDLLRRFRPDFRDAMPAFIIYCSSEEAISGCPALRRWRRQRGLQRELSAAAALRLLPPMSTLRDTPDAPDAAFSLFADTA